jgi:hypothetical protein
LAITPESGPIAQNAVESSAAYFICLYKPRKKDAKLIGTQKFF